MAAFGTAFAIRLKLSPFPMLPIDLFARPIFALSVATSVCSFIAQSLALVSLPFYFEHDLGLSQVTTGLLITPWPLAIAVVAPISGHYSDRYPAGILGGIGLGILSVGLVLLAFLPAHPGYADVAWRMTICGVGFGMFQIAQQPRDPGIDAARAQRRRRRHHLDGAAPGTDHRHGAGGAGVRPGRGATRTGHRQRDHRHIDGRRIFGRGRPGELSAADEF